jgi:hypothetical protein
MEYINLPHKDKNNWNKICEKYFKKNIKNFSDLNVIFFDGKYPFFNEINQNYKKEGDEFVKVYKYLQKLILNLDEKILPYEIKILKTKENDKLELTRRQVAILFLLSFFKIMNKELRFCVYNIISTTKKGVKFEFGRCFLNYLTNIGKWLSEKNPILDEKIKFIRISKNKEPNDYMENTEFCDINIYTKGSLLDGDASYCVDFANKYIGGGVLIGGCAQEEKLFAIQTEAIVSILFMEKMGNNDAIRIDNIIQYSNYEGYGESFVFKSNAIGNDTNKIKKTKIIAIDAFPHSQIRDQKIIERDIYKAFVGFKMVFYDEKEGNEEKTIATGNWGCGVFGGDFELKFLQQWIAASFVGIKRLDYYTFNNKNMKYIIEKLKEIKNKYRKVKDLYTDLCTKKFSKGKVVKILLGLCEEDDDCIII